MSAFLSAKYMKYRAALTGGEIVDDLACRGCGYNVRGLKYGRNCPECGQMIEVSRGLLDVLADGDIHDRQRWRLGLAAAAACIGAVIVLRVGLFLGGLGGRTVTFVRSEIVAYLVPAVVWTVAAWLITPSSLDDVWPRMRGLRRMIRLTQLLWVPAYGLLLIQSVLMPAGTSAPWIDGTSLIARGVAGVGMLLLAGLMSFVAREAQLDATASRLERSIAWVALFTLLLVAFIRGYSGALPWPMLLFVIPMLGAWCWFLTLMAMGYFDLHQHVSWTIRHATESGGREIRIAATRQKMEDQANAVIRPVDARPRSDVPIDRDGEATGA